MLRRIQGWLKSAGGVGVAAACLAGSAAYAEDENPKVKPKVEVRGGVTVQVLEEGKDGKGKVIFLIGEEKEEGKAERKPERKEGEKKEREAKEIHRDLILHRAEVQEAGYWIGIRCDPVDDVLRAQLNLGEGRGLVIEEVVPDSPAAKVGLKKYDVLIQAGETLLDDVATLVDVVAKTKDGELKLKLIRGGDSQTVSIKPAKRAGEEGSGQGTVILWDENEEAVKNLLKQLEQQLEKARKGEGRGGEVPKIQFLHPGVVLPPGGPAPGAQWNPGMPQNAARAWVMAAQAAPLPEDMTVTISKSGKNPAKVTVKQGEKSWETSDDKLDVLPDEVREHVLRMLGRAPMNRWGGGFGPANPQAGGGLRQGAVPNPNPNPAPKTDEPNPKPQPGANPASGRVIELEITPGGELKRTERKPGETKPTLQTEAILRLQTLQNQLQNQARQLQVKAVSSVEERVERALHELHEKFESVEQRLKKLEQRLAPQEGGRKPAAANPADPAPNKAQTIIIRELENTIKKLEEKKPTRKSNKDDDDKDEKKKDKD